MTPGQFAEMFHVKQATIEEIEKYVDLLTQWSQRINLVSKPTLKEVWQRHIADSAQLLDIPGRAFSHWLDFGSGAGFPALILAILAKDRQIPATFTLVESDQRKCAFLAQVARTLSLTVRIIPARLEEVEPLRPDIISARAVASLSNLLSLAATQRTPETLLIFPKGNRLDAELTEAGRDWHIVHDRIPSRTDPSGEILSISEYRPR